MRRISLGTVFREMFETFANRSFLAIFVTALVANENGIFGVYSMREVFEYTRFW